MIKVLEKLKSLGYDNFGKISDSGADPSVSTLHDDYLAHLDNWSKVEDAIKSEKHIHDKGETYLPKLNKQNDIRYSAYKARASFPQYTKHTLECFVGMAMRKDILISEIDKDHQFFKNCDGKGGTIKEYCENLIYEYLKKRRCVTLVDYPTVSEELSVADAEKLNILPRLSFYKAEDVINWKTKVIDNVKKLCLLVLREQVDLSSNEFVSDNEYNYRVLRLKEIDGRYIYTQQLYDNKFIPGNEIIIKQNNKPMSSIPVIVHGGLDIKSSVMLPIAEQNIHWYMLDADHKHGLHYTALPTPWVTGISADDDNRPTTIGSEEIWYLPEDCVCGMLEFTGAGLAGIKSAKDECFDIIVTLSSQILIPSSSQDETATAASIRNATETASLSAIVTGISGEITKAVKIASKWGNFYVDGTRIEINSDFIPLTLSGADVSAYVSSVLKSGFSMRTLFNVLKKGEIIEGDRQFEDELADIKKEQKEADEREINKAKRLAEVSSAYEEKAKNTQNPDVKQKRTQSNIATAKSKSGSGIEEEN